MILNKKQQPEFGALSLNLDTLRRLDRALEDGKNDAMMMKPKDTAAACPKSTQTKVTAHCC